MPQIKGHLVAGLLLVLLGLAGTGLILYATIYGPVIFSDSVGYLTVARNFLAGYGFGAFEASGQFGLMTFHPPFYPFLLAFFGLSGVDVVVITRWLQALCFGLVVFFTGWGFWRLANSLWLALCAALAVLASPLLLYLFCLAMTEPLFILLSVCAALGLLHALGQDQLKWLIIAAICAGLAVITRLVGAAWVAGGVLVVMMFWPSGWKRRLGVAACFGGHAVLPLALWLGWVRFFTNSPERVRTSLQLGQSLAEFRLAMVDIFWNWLPFAARLPEVHYRVKTLALLALLATSIVVVIFTAWRAARTSAGGWRAGLQEPTVRAASLLWLSLVAYLGIAAFGYAYSNPTPDLNERTLSMGLLIGLGVTFTTCAAVYRAWPALKWRHLLPVVCAGVCIASGLPQSLQMLTDYHREGFGYLSPRWRDSATVAAAKELPVNTPIISNEHSALAFWLGRPVYPMNEVVALQPQPLDARYGDTSADDAQQVFRQQGAALVIFDNIRWQLDALYFEQTPERLEAMFHGLGVHGDYGDGAIYFYPTDQP